MHKTSSLNSMNLIELTLKKYLEGLKKASGIGEASIKILIELQCLANKIVLLIFKEILRHKQYHREWS